MKRDHVFFAIASVVVLALSQVYTPGQVGFRSFEVAEVASLFTLLFFVALLFERSIEVFVGGIRSQTEQDRDARAKVIYNQNKGNRTGAQAEAFYETCKRQAENEYKTRTKTVVVTVSMFFGIVVAAVGVRALETFIAPDFVFSNALQEQAFHLLDIVLTGGLIAGGAEGIHKITKVFDEFMTTTANRAKGQPATA